MFRFLSAWIDQLLWFLFAPDCPVCGQLSSCGGLCRRCEVICPITQQLCFLCGFQTINHQSICIDCEEKTNHPVERIHSLLWFNEEARRIFHLIKYQRRFEWFSIFEKTLEKTSCPEVFDGAKLVPVPIHPDKFLERGFNQSDLLAGILSKTWNMEISEGLIKTIQTLPQSQLGRRERLLNLKNCFSWERNRPVPKNIVLIDDVLTTGETLRRCGLTLKAAGAEHIYAWTLFRTIPEEIALMK